MPNKLHDAVLNFLENYRSNHPELVYWLRERNTKNRLADGYWFQGNEDYAFVGLYDRGGGSNMTRSLGLVFWEEDEDELGCYLELVFNEEADERILEFYKELMKELGGFEKITETKYRRGFTGEGRKAAEEFLNSVKPKIDELLQKLKLDRLFITTDSFREKLEKIEVFRKSGEGSLFPAYKIVELKKLYEEFKADPFYLERIKQLNFIPFAKKIIEKSLENNVTNETFTGLIQILKNGAKIDTVSNHIDKNIEGNDLKSALKKEFSQFGFTGYTSAGKTGINGLDNDQLETVKKFILDCSAIKTKGEAAKRVEEFDILKIPQVKCGVYSPWLYYINPSVFPIKNNSHDGFIQWCNQPTSSYPTAILLFHEVAEILGEKDLGLLDAFTHMFAEENEEFEISSDNKKISMSSLNTILYGPPGTGKTYHTINKSVAIANPQFDIAAASREQLKKEYERLVKDGQIEFITFHQSMSYEDFIEGIKPMEPKQEDEFLKYEIKEGIFKRLCERASKVPETNPTGFSISDDEFQKAGFYKISLGDTSNPDDDQIYEWCIKNGYMALGWGDAIDFTEENENDIQQMVPDKIKSFAAQALNSFIHHIKLGDYVVVTYGNHLFRAIGKITGNYEYKKIDGLSVYQFRKVEWLVKDIELPYEEIYDRQFSQQTIYRMDKKGIKKEFFVKAGAAVPEKGKPKNYVLIIDEINRGNVSQIFGELITLIEEDKRTGNSEALTAVLPYSKKPFSVPPNLYIIGTMNTADRSVEALDTALRRRFTFEEMNPKPKLLSPQRIVWEIWWKYEVEYWDEEPYASLENKLYPFLGIEKGFGHDDKLWDSIKGNKNESQIDLFNKIPFTGEGINLQLLLEKINKRLNTLLSKDHTIGHAWFMNVYSLEDLQVAFKNKIIPLLQEFFYNDYAKIGLVLGDKFVEQTKAGKSLFATFKDDNELAAEYEDKLIYTLKDCNELMMEDFKSVYE